MTLSLDDGRWRAAIEADLLGEASAEQQAFARTHTPVGEEHRAEQAFLDALRAEDNADPDDAADAATVTGVVDAFVDGRPAGDGEQAPTHRRSATPWVVSGAAVLAAVAAAAVFWFGSRDADPQTTERDAEGETVAVADAPMGPWRVTSGFAALETGASRFASELPEGVPLVAGEDTCAEHRGSSACWSKGARFVARPTGQFTLLEGTVEVRATQPGDQAVDLGDLRIEPNRGSVVVLERSVAGTSVRVDVGTIVAVGPTERRVLTAGDTLRRADPVEGVAPPEADVGEAEGSDTGPAEVDVDGRRPSRAAGPRPSELLRRAREERRAGRIQSAIATYEELVQRHPRSAAARTAMVSAGQLHLERGNAKAALRAFRRYRRRGGGTLAEDAAYGEVRALRALGRSQDAKQAAARFLARYPDSHYGAKLRP